MDPSSPPGEEDKRDRHRAQPWHCNPACCEPRKCDCRQGAPAVEGPHCVGHPNLAIGRFESDGHRGHSARHDPPTRRTSAVMGRAVQRSQDLVHAGPNGDRSPPETPERCADARVREELLRSRDRGWIRDRDHHKLDSRGETLHIPSHITHARPLGNGARVVSKLKHRVVTHAGPVNATDSSLPTVQRQSVRPEEAPPLRRGEHSGTGSDIGNALGKPMPRAWSARSPGLHRHHRTGLTESECPAVPATAPVAIHAAFVQAAPTRPRTWTGTVRSLRPSLLASGFRRRGSPFGHPDSTRRTAAAMPMDRR